MLPGHDGTSNVVYDEDGTIYCYDKVSEPPVRHKMAYIGHEPGRETLKYRCPAKHEGWECPMSAVCNAGKSYGKTVRVPREMDPRRFPALPRATKKFERMYKGRTAVERVNARLKVFWGVDDGNVTGSRRFVAQVGVVLAVHAAFATLLASAPRREGTLGKTRLSPIAEALRAAAAAEAAQEAPGGVASGGARVRRVRESRGQSESSPRSGVRGCASRGLSPREAENRATEPPSGRDRASRASARMDAPGRFQSTTQAPPPTVAPRHRKSSARSSGSRGGGRPPAGRVEHHRAWP